MQAAQALRQRRQSQGILLPILPADSIGMVSMDSYDLKCEPVRYSTHAARKSNDTKMIASFCDRHLLFGSHHKSGTKYSLNLLIAICGGFDRKDSSKAKSPVPDERWLKPTDYSQGRPTFDGHVSQRRLREVFHRFVHFIRDPVEWVVSNYQYHLVTTEKWVLEHQAKLRKANVTTGLLLEWERAKSELHTMIRIYQLSQQSTSVYSTFTVRLEQITFSEKSRERILQGLLEWLRWPTQTWPANLPPTTSSHSTSKAEKTALHALLWCLKGEELAFYRQQLGYPPEWRQELERCEKQQSHL